MVQKHLFKLKTIAAVLAVAAGVTAAPQGEYIRVSESENGVLTADLDFGTFSKTYRQETADIVTVYKAKNSTVTSYYDKLSVEGLSFAVVVQDDALPPVTCTYSSEVRSPDFSGVKLPGDYQNLTVSELRNYQGIKYRIVSVFPFYRNGQAFASAQVRVQLQRPGAGIPVSGPQKRILNRLVVNAEDARRAPSAILRKAAAPFTEKGRWIGITVAEEGIYRIRASDLSNAGIDPGTLIKDKIRLFSDSRFGLPYTADLPDPDSLFTEIPLLFIDGSGDVWDTEDMAAFYAPGPGQWLVSDVTQPQELQYRINPFDTVQRLWLFIPDDMSSAIDGKRIRFADITGASHGEQRDWSWDCLHHEKEEQNPQQGGTDWYGESFSGRSWQESIELDLPTAPASGSKDAMIRLAAAGGSTSGNSSHSHSFSFSLNGLKLQTSLTMSDYRAQRKDLTILSSLLNRNNTLSVSYTGNTDLNVAYMDYVDIIYPSDLQTTTDVLTPRFMGISAPFSFQAGGFGTYPAYVFDVTRSTDPVCSVVADAGAWINDDGTRVSSRYYIATESAFRSPASFTLSSTFNPDRSAWLSGNYDMVIISHTNFIDEAERLAEHKAVRAVDPLKVLVADMSDVYNRYSGGQTDPRAIRNFLLDLKLHNGTVPLRYVLLFGDGSYDYRNISGKAQNYIPQFEISAWDINDTRNSEDPFVYLSSNTTNTVDYPLGRLPVNSAKEAADVVDKIISYETRTQQGDWQARVTLVADDPTDPDVNNTDFILDTENKIAPLFPQGVIRNKLYLTEFPELYDPTIRAMGRVGARDAIISAFNNGSAIVNFIGHGSPTVWAQEYVFVKDRDLPLLKNTGKYPLVVAATCDWGRSDYTSSQSAAEDIVTLEDGGAIAAIAATRPVYNSDNVALVRKFYGTVFTDSASPTNPVSIGEGLMIAKQLLASNATTGNSIINASKFLLIGDPSLYLTIPGQSGEFTSISDDTLKALELVHVEGTIAGGSTSGIQAELQLFDSGKRVIREYRYLSGGSYQTGTVNYTLGGNRLFTGPVSVSDAAFTGRFIIPKDISYQGNSGILRLQYWSPENSAEEGMFARNNLIIQGSSDSVQTDFQGPSIRLMNGKGQELSDDDLLDDSSRVQILISDPGGINITGSTGHGINLVLDGGQSYDITSDFKYDRDSWSDGSVLIRAGDYFENGRNHFQISAFDNYNNFASIEGDITVLTVGEAPLTEIVNFPNPFQSGTAFTFKTGLDGSVKISVYTAGGRKILNLPERSVSQGFNYIDWDGEDNFGQKIAAGPYLYTLTFTTESGRRFDVTGTCVKLP